MEYAVIAMAALLTSGLTLFSGFGLGTLLKAGLCPFLSVKVAIASTAVVHLWNNLFKWTLVGKFANRSVVLRCGLPAILAAYLGAHVLLRLSDFAPLGHYQFLGRDLEIMPVKLIIAFLMVGFALFEILPRFKKISFLSKHLPIEGVLSGFFGGISGHQGALRSAFLLKSGLSKEGSIATGVIISCLVDISRILVYGTFFKSELQGQWDLILIAVLSAFSGAWLGTRFIKKVTFEAIQMLVAFFLFLIAIGLGTGLLWKR